MNSTDKAPDGNTRFVADVKGVKEVILIADADLAFWQAQLKSTGLHPWAANGKAMVSISATDLHWMSSHTNELTIGVAVSTRADADTPDGQFLVYAFNSSRLFAFIERTFFRTPYHHGGIRLEVTPPASIQLDSAGAMALRASMAGAIAPTASEEQVWQGPIFLPQNPESYFIARLGGLTETYPFAAADRIEIQPGAALPVAQQLLASNLVGREWRIRRDARHARTKTFRRSRAPLP